MSLFRMVWVSNQSKSLFYDSSFCPGYDLESANFSVTDEKVLFLPQVIETQKFAAGNMATLGDVKFFGKYLKQLSVLCLNV